MSKATQKERILSYMQEFGSITSLEALRDIGVMRLSARISEMKRDGVIFSKSTEHIINRYGEKTPIKRYYLAERVLSE